MSRCREIIHMTLILLLLMLIICAFAAFIFGIAKLFYAFIAVAVIDTFFILILTFFADEYKGEKNI